MNTRLLTPLLALLLSSGVALPAAYAAPGNWTEGTDYFLISPTLNTSVPAGKIEVTEVFSYACPHCAEFRPVANELKASLPPNAVFDVLPASFNPTEDWPMFQRAFCTAQVLGIAARAHNAIFDAVWKSGELAVVDSKNALKDPPPSIQDAARVYNRLTGVAVDKFLAVSRSFAVNVKMKTDDAYILHGQVDSTPTIVVNGKYRVTLGSAGGDNQLIQLVKYLVQKESH